MSGAATRPSSAAPKRFPDGEVEGARQATLDATSYKVQHLQQLQLWDRPQASYRDDATGPVRPGLGFFKWFFQGGALQVPLAETIVIDKDVVRVLRTGADGFLQRETVRYSRQEDRDAFVLDCLERFVKESRPLGQFPQSLVLQDRFVAVAKRAGGRQDGPVSAACELLIPAYFQVGWAPLYNQRIHPHCSLSPPPRFPNPNTNVPIPCPQAVLAEALDNKTQTLCLQRFVKSRGGKAGIYRVFWKATACGAGPSGAVAGWFISRGDAEFLAVERDDAHHIDEGERGPVLLPADRLRGGRVSSSERAALERRVAAVNRDILAEMAAKPDMSMSERALAVSVGQKAHRAAEWANLCSLSPGLDGGGLKELGGMTPKTVNDTATSRCESSASECPYLRLSFAPSTNPNRRLTRRPPSPIPPTAGCSVRLWRRCACTWSGWFCGCRTRCTRARRLCSTCRTCAATGCATTQAAGGCCRSRALTCPRPQCSAAAHGPNTGPRGTCTCCCGDGAKLPS